jgi:hypothetical protein
MYDVSADEIKQARAPHELFLINLITNHILIFVATLGFASHNVEPLMAVPVISFCILSYTLWRARRSRRIDPWYVMCHWQVAARRSRFFIGIMLLLCIAATLAWVSYTHWGVMREAAWALVGGFGLLPTLVSVLVLILLESDALHQARQGKIPQWVSAKYPQVSAANTPV